MLFGIKALFSQGNCVSLCIYVPQFLRVWERVCTGVLLPMCMHACMFIIQLIVYGSCFLWHNKLKLLNPFDADNAISQGYHEWVRDALGTSDLSDETSVLWVTVFLLWFLFCMDRLRQAQALTSFYIKWLQSDQLWTSYYHRPSSRAHKFRCKKYSTVQQIYIKCIKSCGIFYKNHEFDLRCSSLGKRMPPPIWWDACTN